MASSQTSYTTESIPEDSQLTEVDSILDSTTTQDLQRLKTGGRNIKCYLFMSEIQSTFIDWFQKTQWYEENQRQQKPKRILWGSPKQAQVWTWFQEAATKARGEPSVVCNRCDRTLQHPALGNGNKALDNHVASQQCRSVATHRGLSTLYSQPGYREKACFNFSNTPNIYSTNRIRWHIRRQQNNSSLVKRLHGRNGKIRLSE